MDPRDWDADLPVPGAAPPLVGDAGHATSRTARLERWAAEARVDEAARRRSRERWLLQSAEEGGALAGVLADLAEQGTPVTVRTSAGRRHTGRLRAVGADFVALATAAGDEVLVAIDAVSSVRTARARAPLGDRMALGALTLAEALAGLAAERDRALLVTRDGGDTVSGTLRAVGADVVVVRLDGDAPPAGTAYVPLAAIGEVVLGAWAPPGVG
jgi:hypothetical protein